MSLSPRGASNTLDYEPPRPARARPWLVLGWLMPLWCVLLIGIGMGPLRRHDDTCWVLAMALPLAVGVEAHRAGARGLGLYCLIIFVVLLATGVLLPTFRWA